MDEEDGTLSWGLMVETIRTLRQWKQARLAESAGISKTSLSDYERGKLDPPEEVRERVEKALGVAGWTGTARGLLGGLLTAIEGGPMSPDVDQVVKRATAELAASAETLLRAGLEEIRRLGEEDRRKWEEEDRAAESESEPDDPQLPL
jgi:transcriptional regulator with XRE-family HTH domain